MTKLTFLNAFILGVNELKEVLSVLFKLFAGKKVGCVRAVKGKAGRNLALALDHRACHIGTTHRLGELLEGVLVLLLQVGNVGEIDVGVFVLVFLRSDFMSVVEGLALLGKRRLSTFVGNDNARDAETVSAFVVTITREKRVVVMSGRSADRNGNLNLHHEKVAVDLVNGIAVGGKVHGAPEVRVRDRCHGLRMNEVFWSVGGGARYGIVTARKYTAAIAFTLSLFWCRERPRPRVFFHTAVNLGKEFLRSSVLF